MKNWLIEMRYFVIFYSIHILNKLLFHYCDLTFSHFVIYFELFNISF